ncbi:MAG: ACP S-malonyltransferase [Deltaproteobacteria bacterium]|nr:ACP S-malonyltransferase [Deltaproteobacteria bacterium]
MVTLLFPGQGSQAPGMGKDLAETSAAARDVFAEADDALEMPISRICFEGEEAELKRTEITQPAILTVSIAAFRAFREMAPDAEIRFAAGHSLGEWSALVAVGALSFADAVRAVRARGQLMQAAVPEGEGLMAAVLGLAPDVVRKVCKEVQRSMGSTHVVGPANFNSPEQTVISGTADAVRTACEALQGAGAQKTVLLPVSAPFHSPLMIPAAQGLRDVLASISVSSMSAPVVTNVDAAPNQDHTRVKDLLVEQVTAPVRWTESVEAIAAAGEDTALELGPGKVLMGLARRIDRRLKVTPVGDGAALEKAVAQLLSVSPSDVAAHEVTPRSARHANTASNAGS